MSEYAGRQFVGIDLHRRRSVIVRTTDAGDPLEAVRVGNDVNSLVSVQSRAGEAPEVVLEATYGWYWAVDALQAAGANVHLAHPLGVKGFAYRRVKNDVRDAADLADLLRMGRLPQAWIAPPATRDLRELVRHRAKLVALRSGLQVRGSRGAGQARRAGADERPVRRAWAGTARAPGCAGPVSGADPVDAAAHRRVGRRDRPVRPAGPWQVGRRPGLPVRADDPRDRPVLAAVFVAEIGDVGRFRSAAHLASWAGLTPKHRESDTHVRRGRITKQGSRLSFPSRHAIPDTAGNRTGHRQRPQDLGDRRISRYPACPAPGARR
ncbi:IS110 family transposase [Monashia sp. NPDC004114]